jgi:DNA-binding XRE family transcriptional regulator
MEMHERIKELRKNHLNLSQEAFGEHLGVSRSVINNIERNALARPEQKLSLIRLMCKEFNVNEEWVLNGTGPMFVQPETFSLDSFVKERGMSERELRILKRYFALDPKTRQEALSYFLDNLDEEKDESEMTFDELIAECPKTPEELERLYPPVNIKPKVVSKHKVI